MKRLLTSFRPDNTIGPEKEIPMHSAMLSSPSLMGPIFMHKRT